jgi:Tol biopolymer transport system component
MNAHISPDGQWVAFASDRSGNFEIWRAGSDGANPVQLTRFSGRSAGTPRWSPDSRYIAFDLTSDSNADIWVMAADGGQQRQITSDPAREFVPSWSPDGKFIYFGSLKTGSPQVWRIPAAGGQPVQVTRHGGYGGGWQSAEGYFYVTKQGDKQLGDPGGVYRVDPVTQRDEAVIPGPINWSRVAFTSKGLYYVKPSDDDSFAAYLHNFQTGARQAVATLARPSAIGLSIAPGEKWAAYGAIESAGSDLMLIDGFRH